jgi:hypothetical protein
MKKIKKGLSLKRVVNKAGTENSTKDFHQVFPVTENIEHEHESDQLLLNRKTVKIMCLEIKKIESCIKTI